MKHYLESTESVLKEVESSASGLTAEEAAKRLEKVGQNKLDEPPKPTLLARFVEQFKNPMILVLIAAAVISAITGIISEGKLDADVFIIMFVVIANAVLGVYQENKAESAIEALQAMSAAQSKVYRSGEMIVIPSSELVPGDVIALEAGDNVPADCRILEAAALKAEESALTGESVPSEKESGVLSGEEVPLGDRKNMLYMGSSIAYGRAEAVVVATGMQTEMGKIAGAIANADDDETPLQKSLDQLSKILSVAVLVICVIILGINVIQMLVKNGNITLPGFLDSFMIAVSLAVAAIPEGLAAVVTVVLSIGVTNMSKRGAIIRRLTAVEALGCAQVICSDKTGTLTQNKMTVVCLVWENKTPFPIAFSASREILTAQITPDNVQAVNDQNDLLNKICGSETNVFEHIDPSEFTNDNADIDTSNGIWMYHDFTRIDENLPVTVTWLYIVQDDMPIYLEHNFNGGQLTVNGNIFDLGSEKFRCIGSYAPGTELRIEYITDDIGRGSFGLDLYRFNMDKWNSIYDSVKANGLEVSSFKNTKIKGSLNASEAGLVMTSIPQDGGWTVYVDGKKTSNFKVLGTLIGFNVGAGNHDIEFKYHVPLFKAGFLLTLLALAALVLCLRIRKGGGIKFKKKEKVSENHEKADEAEKSNEKSSKKPENIKTAKDYEKELTRSKSYIVTHEYETVILRNVDNNLKIATIAKFGKDDPGDAKITENEKYCVVIGWGAIIYKLQPPFENYLSGLNTTQWKKYLVDENTWFEEIKEITAEYAILVAENGEEHKVEFDF